MPQLVDPNKVVEVKPIRPTVFTFENDEEKNHYFNKLYHDYPNVQGIEKLKKAMDALPEINL